MDNERLIEKIEQLEKEIIDLKASVKNRKGFFLKAFSKLNVITGVFISALITSAVLYAAQISFTDGDPISADQVNGNFTELYDAIASMDTLLSGIETTFSGVTRTDNVIQFSGVNVQIVSGSGATDGAVNGLGNLIVGYNELRGSGDDRTGSHNIVVGRRHNFSSYGGLVLGYQNTISGQYSSVSGGCLNIASGVYSSISGGYTNAASGRESSISGGGSNIASGQMSSISGGNQNTASGTESSVSGGYNRSVNDYYDWCAGSLFETQ